MVKASTPMAYGLAFLAPIACAMAASSLWYPLTPSKVSLADGEASFRKLCVTCHTLDASIHNGIGPSLERIGADAATRIPGYSTERYLYESILKPEAFKLVESGPQMPSGLVTTLSQNELRNLIAYLASRGNTPDYRSILQLPMELDPSHGSKKIALSLDRIEEGRNLFQKKYKCNQCHNLGEAIPGMTLIAPSLAGIGVRGRESITTAIRHPNEHIADSYRMHRCLTIDGRAILGRLLSKTKNGVKLLTQSRSGGWQVEFIPIDDLESLGESVVALSPTSTMPEWSAAEMSDNELNAIVDFLLTQR